MESETIIIVFSVLGATWLLLAALVALLFFQVHALRKRINQMQATGRIRVQKLRMDNDRNHAFHNPALSPDEELSKRGFSMYEADERDNERERDLESGRSRERQTGGLSEELAREIDSRQQRQSAPPFLLQSIEENKRKRMSKPANGRQSDTNPNFIY